MQNKFVIHLVLANFLWSLIPVLVAGLFEDISILMVIFLRFFVSGIILFVIAIFIIIFNNRNASHEEMKISLKKLLHFTTRNNRAFKNIRYFNYFAILGFVGIILQIIFFFLALKVTTIAFTMIGFQISIIFIAFYEHGVRAERLDLFKMLYLLILVFTTMIIMFVELQLAPKNLKITFRGFMYVLIFAICISFLQIGMAKDSYSSGEIKFVNINRNYKIVRMIIKLSLIFLMGIALMFPFILIAYFLPFTPDLNNETDLFFKDFIKFGDILLRWDVLFIIIFSTVIPYLLIFIAMVNWSPYSLTYSQWGSILAIVEPIGGILFGVLIINEFFPLEFLVIVLFLLTLSILLRYAHEIHNKVNAYILLTHKRGGLEKLSVKLIKLEGIRTVEVLIGDYDLKLNIKMNSIKAFYYLTNKLRNIKEIEQMEIFFIDSISKIT